MMTLIERLEAAALMPEGELRSRKNALGEVKALLLLAANALVERPKQERTGPEVAQIAGLVLSPGFHPSDLSLAQLKSMAASLLTQAPDLPPANPVVMDNMTPEAKRALEDAVRTNQAKPIISRAPVETPVVEVPAGPAGDPPTGATRPPYLADEGKDT